jgi:hypothetical protein
MDFTDKYTNTTDSEAGKVVLSDDIFALCEMLDRVAVKLG